MPENVEQSWPRGRLVTPVSQLKEKLTHCRALLFDWDGVFNSGFKNGVGGSGFSEVDAMGTNLLRFGMWRQHGKLPVTSVLTGEQNPQAVLLAEREHFHSVISQAKNKLRAFEHWLTAYGLEASQVIFFFDDVLDLPVARACGVRIFFPRPAAPALEQFVLHHQLADYLTGCSGDAHGVRESCEMLLTQAGLYGDVVEHRLTWSEQYQAYWEQRQAIVTRQIAGGL